MSDISGDIPAEHAKSAPFDRAVKGPFDLQEANLAQPYVDLGGMRIPPRPSLGIRLEIETGSKRIIAVGLDYADSTLQVQAFAAPRGSGLWHEIREQIAEQIARQGGNSRQIEGSFGPELQGNIPVAQGKKPSTKLMRFIGVDGPRWFLRGVIGGKALTDPETATQIEDLFRSVVVVRGQSPMPPRDLIPLQTPTGQQGSLTEEAAAAESKTP